MTYNAEFQNTQPKEPFPQPRRNDGGAPCGECHIKPGEVCDICGAIGPTPAHQPEE
jgi:hypothetical protein